MVPDGWGNASLPEEPCDRPRFHDLEMKAARHVRTGTIHRRVRYRCPGPKTPGIQRHALILAGHLDEHDDKYIHCVAIFDLLDESAAYC